MDENQLQKAIALSRAGKKDQARILLKEIVKEEPFNETAWLWLVDSFSNTELKLKAIELWLKTIPNQSTALELKKRIQESEVNSIISQEQPLNETQTRIVSKSQKKKKISPWVWIIGLVFVIFGGLIVNFVWSWLNPYCNCDQREQYMENVLSRVERWKTQRAIYTLSAMFNVTNSVVENAETLYDEELSETIIPGCMQTVHQQMLELFRYHVLYNRALVDNDRDSASYYIEIQDDLIIEINQEIYRVIEEETCTQ